MKSIQNLGTKLTNQKWQSFLRSRQDLIFSLGFQFVAKLLYVFFNGFDLFEKKII